MISNQIVLERLVKQTILYFTKLSPNLLWKLESACFIAS